jgi:hypothetical protein
MRGLVLFMRRPQSREIGLTRLVCGSRALGGRGIGNKYDHRGGQCRNANKTKARHNSSAAPRIAAVLRTTMTQNRVILIRAHA